MNAITAEERTSNIPSAVAAPKLVPRSPTARVDMYRSPHKMLRFLLANLLLKMGTTSFGDGTEARAVIGELEVALWACDGHIQHEDVYIRPALAGRASNAVSTLDAEHAEHAQQVAELRALAAALVDATSAEAREALGETLYLHFSVFVAETLAHMAYEQRVVQPLLDRLFTTDELMNIHGALIASIAPQEMILYLRVMVPASSREERAETLGNVKRMAPPDLFAELMSDLRPRLAAEDWADLRSRLEL